MGTITCANCGAEVELPKKEFKPRGTLAGKTLPEMTMEELKQERRNAKSVLYKATKAATPNEERILANQIRVEAVEEEIAKRKPVVAAPVAEEVQATEEAPAEEVVSEEVYEEQPAEV